MFLIILLRLILTQNTSGSIDSISQITQIVSYGLITLIGLFLFLSSIPGWFKKQQITKSPLVAAFAIGIVPCPGIIMILLFCLSLDQMVLGFFLAIILSIGMTITITLAIWISLAGKKLTLQISNRWQGGVFYVEQTMQSGSGLLLTCIGGLFLAAALSKNLT